jgi:hypothetical protein
MDADLDQPDATVQLHDEHHQSSNPCEMSSDTPQSPLKEVAISISCAYKSKYDKNDLCYVTNQLNVSNFPREMRDKLAGELNAMLLDPMGNAEELDRWEKKRAELDAKYALVNSAPDSELDDEIESEKDATENSDIESDNDGAGESEGGK